MARIGRIEAELSQAAAAETLEPGETRWEKVAATLAAEARGGAGGTRVGEGRGCVRSAGGGCGGVWGERVARARGGKELPRRGRAIAGEGEGAGGC